MLCPFCKYSITKVIETRESNENTTRRRRECEKCHKRFTTYERIEQISLNVLKRDGRIEEFDPEKIKLGIMKAVKKRPISESQINEIVSDIIHELMNKESTLIKSIEIGEMVLKRLSKIDKLGALLFAAVYKEFATLEDVEKELKRLSKK
ncbi:MAG: transcriptional regulator NrdR [Candidatus Dojkabacteria bacterium]|nr:transcriptional regulator NrdR [Candidatus Dojkabacteria bacterium]